MKIRMHTISATNEETEGSVDAMEEEEKVLNTLLIINTCNKMIQA